MKVIAPVVRPVVLVEVIITIVVERTRVDATEKLTVEGEGKKEEQRDPGTPSFPMDIDGP